MALIHHTFITGQSLVTFNQTPPFLSGAQANPGNTYLSGGVRLLLERANQWPERTLIDATNTVGRLANVRSGGIAGKAYIDLKKGTATYDANIANLAAGIAHASNAGQTWRVDALHVIHGEADSEYGTTRLAYLAALVEWLADYTADSKALTGQESNLVGIAHQTSWKTGNLGPSWAVLDAHRQAPRWFCVGPIYHLEPSTPGGYLHLSNRGSAMLGEYHAKVHRAIVLEAGTWEPVAPSSIVRDGLDITVEFTVPHPPLVFDTTALAARPNMGFTYSDDASSATIAGVEITGPTTVTVTLDEEPTGENPTLRYGPPAATWGGNLRDSDPTLFTLDGVTALRNWCCYFSDPVTVAGAVTDWVDTVGPVAAFVNNGAGAVPLVRTIHPGE